MDLIKIYEPWVATRQKEYINDCLDKNELTFHGEYVSRFAAALAAYLGVKHVIPTCNGSVSLYAILKCLYIDKPEHEVITAGLTYAATLSQIILAGGTPVCVDCDDNLQVNTLDIIQAALAQKRPILIPELYGDTPEHLETLCALCEKNNIFLIEDSAEAFGCKLIKQGKMLGTYGDCASFSFFANKVITCGEGGCVATNDDQFAEQIRSFINQNSKGFYRHHGPGTNFRMTNLQAAIGCAQLEDINEILLRKKCIATYYRKYLPEEIKSIIPRVAVSNEWLPVFLLPKEITYDTFYKFMAERHIETRPVFRPITQMSGWYNKYKTYGLPNAERLSPLGFNLPAYPTLTYEKQEYIVNAVKDCIYVYIGVQ
jgi:perosamine synthetase